MELFDVIYAFGYANEPAHRDMYEFQRKVPASLMRGYDIFGKIYE